MRALTAYQDWARKIRESDEKAFQELFMDSYNPLYGYANSFVRDGEVARDILQDVYAHLWNIRDRLDDEKSLKALLYRMTRNRCINQIGAKKTSRIDDLPVSEQPVADSETDDENDYEEPELKQKLDEWIETLPDRQREAFELSRFEGLDHHEIAAVMECAPRTVNNHIVSALHTLRNHLEQWRNSQTT